MTVKLLLFIVMSTILSSVQTKLILKQVVVLNRHGLRAPLSHNLKDISSRAWPEWNAEPGFLTTKGTRLAGYMGSYFADWLRNEGILPANCPSEDDLRVFSNTVERTLTTARSFVEKGFPGCKIPVRHPGINIPNPLFNPVIHNTSAEFKQQAVQEIYEELHTLRLNQAYDILSDILHNEKSRSCEIKKKCNLAKDLNIASIIPGLRPRLMGPLKNGNDAVDAFLMQNYEGFPNKDIAWGQLTDSNSWQTVIQLNRAYFNVTYKTSLVARDLSGPLIKCMSEIFLNDDNKPKVTLLFGHDVNIHTVFKTLLVKPYSLEHQLEVIPIGSAVVFQKLKDDESEEYYFKLSVVYQTTEQLRDGNILSLDLPPQVKTLELENCTADVNGVCPWDDFRNFLVSLDC